MPRGYYGLYPIRRRRVVMFLICRLLLGVAGMLHLRPEGLITCQCVLRVGRISKPCAFSLFIKG